MKISYAITVCNEHKEIERLLTFLFEHKRIEDQVIVQMDLNATKEVINVCERFENKPMSEYKLNQFALNKNFAEYKNNLNKECDGNWIFQIDADEIPNEYFQLTGFGDVYLVWKVDLELAPEVQKCWVQVGDPSASPIAGIGIARSATDRLDDDPEDDTGTEGTYSVKIGTVTEDNRIQQRVSGDVSWRPVVLDRTRD